MAKWKEGFGLTGGMEMLRSSQFEYTALGYISTKCKESSQFSHLALRVPFSRTKLRLHAAHSRIVPYSKGSTIQEFQDFMKPKRLLRTTEANVYEGTSVDEIYTLFEVDSSSVYYSIQLQTSRDFGSGLSDSSAILLCLIDINGDSILQRIPATITSKHLLSSIEINNLDSIPFQRGSTDWIIFKGPLINKIEAVWISVESGCWRIGDIGLIVMYPDQPSPSSTGDGKLTNYSGLKYKFELTDILLGEHGDMSMTELRPVYVTTLNKTEELLPLFRTTTSSQSSTLHSQRVSTEESMEEYKNLKFSLLLYDSIIILAGTTLLTFSMSEISEAFFIGGVCGFLYLLLLQRSVDGLSGSALSAMNEKGPNLIQLLGRFKGPLSNLALFLVFIVVVSKYGLGSSSVAIKPEELLVGTAGFLTCKIAVVLAALKPLSINIKRS